MRAFLFGKALLHPTSQALRASSPSRGASGEETKLSVMPRPLLARSNNDDRRQWRKQGVAVGAAASKTQAKRRGCWVPQPGQWLRKAQPERFILHLSSVARPALFRPAQTLPTRQWLSLWESWREAPERARTLPKELARSADGEVRFVTALLNQSASQVLLWLLPLTTARPGCAGAVPGLSCMSAGITPSKKSAAFLPPSSSSSMYRSLKA